MRRCPSTLFYLFLCCLLSFFLVNSPFLFFNEIWHDKFTLDVINVTLSWYIIAPVPMIVVNGNSFSDESIKKMEIDCSVRIPTISVVVVDTQGTFDADNTPRDGDVISVRIAARQQDTFKDSRIDFDIDEIESEQNFYVMSIDLSEGVGRDYTIFNIFKVNPISTAEAVIEPVYNCKSVCPKLPVKISPAFRFSHVFNIQDLRSNELPIILVALPMMLSESINIIKSIIDIDFKEKRITQATLFSRLGNKMFLIIILLYIFLIFSFNRIS